MDEVTSQSSTIFTCKNKNVDQRDPFPLYQNQEKDINVICKYIFNYLFLPIFS